MPFTFNCPSCQIELEAQDEWENRETVCPQCGKNIQIRKCTPGGMEPDEKYCPHCGRIIKKRAVFCKFCRRELNGLPVRPRRHVIPAAVLGGALVMMLVAAASGRGDNEDFEEPLYEDEPEDACDYEDAAWQYFYDLGRSRAARYDGADRSGNEYAWFMEELKTIPVNAAVDPYAGAAKAAWIQGWRDYMDGR